MQTHHETIAIQQAREYCEQAYKLQMDGRVAEAIKLYNISIEIFDTAEAHTFLGWAYSFLGDYDRAIEECNFAIELDPEYGNPYNDIAAYLIYLSKFTEAEYWLRKAIMAPRYSSRHYAFYNLGRVYERQGKWFEAIRQYQQAIQLEPKYHLAALSLLNLQAKLN